MKRVLVLAGALISIWVSPSLVADEPSNAPKPIPATRPEMKAALEALKERQPRIPQLTPAEKEAVVSDGRMPSDYLPETWGGRGGLGVVSENNKRGDDLLTDPCFWVVSRGNNCHYCLGHQELKLRAAGIDDDKIAALDCDWSGFTPREQAALAFARKLTLEPEFISADDIQTLKSQFSDPEIIELAFTIARFNATNRWTDGMGLPQEHHFSGDREITLTTPTSDQFSHTKSIVIPTTRAPRPPLATIEQAQQAIAATQGQPPRVTLPSDAEARQELAEVVGDRPLWTWERALAQLPKTGTAYVKTWNTILTDDNLTPRLKAELTFVTAMNNQAWYAAAHAAHRLKQLGASTEDLTSLLGDHEQPMGGAAAAYRLAAKSTSDPHLVTDADLALVREHFNDRETAEIMQVICLANLFDRFTQALGLPLEDGVADEVKPSAEDRKVVMASQSHQKMLELLEEIRKETPDEHPWLGESGMRQLKEAIAAWQPSDGQAKLWQLRALLGTKEVIYGNEAAGIEQLQQAYELLPAIRDQVYRRQADDTIFQLAVANLRLGESQNCCARNTPDSCIVPIRGAGIHTRTDGSRAAIKYLRELLASPALDHNREMTVRWLLNIAYMTIGEYPDSVPTEYLVPPEVFRSSADFPRFPNVASKLGVDSFNNCGGAIIDDFNGDGYLDIFATTYDTSGEPHLFMNNGSGGFIERAREAGLKGIYGGLNCIQADYDNDGDVDILILRGAWLGKVGRHPNSLLANDGHGNFTDVTFDAGLGEVFYPTHSAAWADYDNDGYLDLYIGHESTKEVSAPSQLFHNNGDGTFTDVAAGAGVENFRFAKGVTWGDYDDDGYPDLYVSNLGDPNRLYHNNHDGTFDDVAAYLKVQSPLKSFACWFWDYNNDGALDLYVTSYSSRMNTVADFYMGGQPEFDPPCLFRGDGFGGFEDVTAQCGLNLPMLPMGANFGDINNDGYPDFYLGTGDPDYFSLMPNLCFINREGKTFENVTMAAGLGHLQKGHGISFADLDNDGDLDIFEQMGGAFRGDKFSDALYENPGFGNNWLSVDLVGKRSNRSAIGARLRAEVVDPDGSVRTVYRHVNSGGSFGANPLRQTIGLGKGGKIRMLEVFWPTTHETQHFREVPTNQLISITEGESDYSIRNLTQLSLH